MVNFCIVVARYNENVEWTKQFPNVVIYNKGDKLEGDYNEIFLPNVGREGHTYYHHICNNYDNLADYTIFLQGNPFDHSPTILPNLNKYINSVDLNFDFEFLSELILDCTLDGCPRHTGLPIRETYERLFNDGIRNMLFYFGAGAQFIVSKKSILKKPVEFYSKIVEMLQYTSNPIEGFVIERLHQVIFCKDVN